MRGLGIWGIGLALTLGLATLTQAGDDAKDDEAKEGDVKPKSSDKDNPWWHGRIFGKKTPAAKEDKKPAPKPAAKKESAKPAAAKPVAKPDESVSERAREEANLLRRLKACDRLREVAFETKDENLERLAEQLEERAQAAYSQRISHLPVSNAAGFISDEDELDKHLGTALPGNRVAGTLPYTVNSKDGKDVAAFSAAREVKP